MCLMLIFKSQKDKLDASNWPWTWPICEFLFLFHCQGLTGSMGGDLVVLVIFQTCGTFFLKLPG